MITAAEVQRDRYYRSARPGVAVSYYMAPRIGEGAYRERLIKKNRAGSIRGQEMSNLRRLMYNTRRRRPVDLPSPPSASVVPPYVLLCLIIRYLEEGATRYTERTSLVVVSGAMRLRQVKHKPRARR